MLANTKSSTNHNLLFYSNKKITKVDYAILAAMPEELKFIKETLKFNESIIFNDFKFDIYIHHNQRIVLAATGIGTTCATSIAMLVYEHFKPDYVLFSGVAGGIKNELNIRDVVIIDKAFEAEIQGAFKLLKNTPFEGCLKHPLKNEFLPSIYLADQTLLDVASQVVCPDIKLHTGTAVTSNNFPAPIELFEKIKNQNPYCIDMEMSAIYFAAWLRKFKVLGIRGISNSLNHDGTDEKIHEADLEESARAAGFVTLQIINLLTLKYKINNQNEFKNENTINDEISKLTDTLNLQPHPEGGYYARVFQSTDIVKLENGNKYNNETRNAGTAIYYLLIGLNNDFSAWHQLKSDELWHHYKGGPINIYMIDKKGNLTIKKLGDLTEQSDSKFLVPIKAGTWFAAEPTDKDSYSLVGCTVCPGFEFKDFKLADREQLINEYPQHKTIIEKFTRTEQEHTKNIENNFAFKM